MRLNQNAQRGSALVYILIAIALLAALTATFMQPSSQQTSAQNTTKAVSEIQGQIDVVRSAIQECILIHPKGDSTISGSTDPGYNIPYPIKPSSDHYDGPPAAVVAKTATNLVKDIRCPGDQEGPNPNDHAKIFSGSSGKHMPPPPDLFTDWQYYNAADGVFFWISTDKTDAFIAAALQKLDANYSSCEADVIDASGSEVSLDSGTTIECASGSLCFRVWMIANASASGPHQDAGCP